MPRLNVMTPPQAQDAESRPARERVYAHVREQILRGVYAGGSFVEDKVKSLDEVLDGTDFPLLPRERGVHLHWLAVQ